MALEHNPDVMRWAVERSGISEERICRAFKKYPKWLSMECKPTLKQLMDFAHMVHINLYDLYSPTIPDYGFQIADFRTQDGSGVVSPAPELYETIEMARYRQNWMSEYFALEGRDPVSFVGSYRGSALTLENAASLAKYLHRFLGLDEQWALHVKTQQEAVRTLRNAIEARGISVAINGVVGDNSHRKLDLQEFRGFVLSDAFAPVIFINGQDAKSAQLFTMIHELAHLAFAETGVVDPAHPEGDSHGFDATLERFCDRVAAEFLVSSDFIGQEWQKAEAATTDDYERVSRIAKMHKVSFMVVARQLFDNDMLSKDRFFGLFRRHQSIMNGLKQKPKKKRDGGNPYGNKSYRLGMVFSEAVWSALNSDAITLSDAYDLAGLTSKSFDEYYRRVFQ